MEFFRVKCVGVIIIIVVREMCQWTRRRRVLLQQTWLDRTEHCPVCGSMSVCVCVCVCASTIHTATLCINYKRKNSISHMPRVISWIFICLYIHTETTLDPFPWFMYVCVV